MSGFCNEKDIIKNDTVPDFKIEVPISVIQKKTDVDYDPSEMTPEQ